VTRESGRGLRRHLSRTPAADRSRCRVPAVGPAPKRRRPRPADGQLALPSAARHGDTEQVSETLRKPGSASVSCLLRATSRSRCHAFRPGPLCPSCAPGPEPGARSGQRHAVHRERGSSSRPFSPWKFVAARQRFRPPGGPVLSWVFNLFRVSPLIASGPCLHGPSSHRLGRAPVPEDGRSLGRTSEESRPRPGLRRVPTGCLTESQRTMRLADLSRDRRTLMRFRAFSCYLAVWRAGSSGLMVSPRVPGCVAVP
jgi:hypothetical protein